MPDRREYYRQYHAAHRERRNVRARERWRERRAFYRRNRLAIKVSEIWNVSIAEARAMIAENRFPE